jgi:hypothetical protein
MQSASDAYKQAMSKKVRDRAYISVGIGVVNQEAQNDASFAGAFTEWSNKQLPFSGRQAECEYATMEQRFLKTDGSQTLLPDAGIDQYLRTGIITTTLLGAVRIDFGNIYSIKGLTVDFSDAFPTAFTVTTAAKTLSYSNDKRVFQTTDVLGDTDHIIITPTAMVGGQQRLRIYGITMGVGLAYGNYDVESASIKEYVSGISAELPSVDFNLSVLDYSGNYAVDDENSFINFLETRQKVTLSFGMTLSNGTVEWIPTATVFLSDWKAQKGKMQFTAKDIFSFMEDDYSLGNKIYTRTAYAEAVSILTDAGLEADEYEVDECLKDVTFINPMPVAKHKECLQLLCNACRCILCQDVYGKIIIRANFANVIEPEDITVTPTGAAAWSTSDNVLTGASVVYADMSSGFLRADGSQLIMPADGNYSQDTGYVTSEVADAQGNFEENPKLALGLPAGYIYFGVYMDFDGVPPQKLMIHTYRNSIAQENVSFQNLKQHNLLNHEFKIFDTIQFEFTKAAPNARVLVKKISFGDLSDYLLSRDIMTAEPVGYKEKTTKDLYVRVFTFQNDSDGNPQQVKDDVWYKKTLNPTGENKYCENQLISSMARAEQLAEWLGNYYNNNISYSAEYRGEPRLHASDLFYMESEVVNNLQVEAETSSMSFNGGFSGSVEMRRALKMTGGNTQ